MIRKDQISRYVGYVYLFSCFCRDQTIKCFAVGVGAPRSSGVSGAPLADALRISATILRERDHKHEHLTALTAIWGQLVSHDIAYTLPISGYSECCGSMDNTGDHAECLPIMMENYTCQEYVRSAIGLKPGCLLGPRLVRV